MIHSEGLDLNEESSEGMYINIKKPPAATSGQDNVRDIDKDKKNESINLGQFWNSLVEEGFIDQPTLFKLTEETEKTNSLPI